MKSDLQLKVNNDWPSTKCGLSAGYTVEVSSVHCSLYSWLLCVVAASDGGCSVCRVVHDTVTSSRLIHWLCAALTAFACTMDKWKPLFWVCCSGSGFRGGKPAHSDNCFVLFLKPSNVQLLIFTHLLHYYFLSNSWLQLGHAQFPVLAEKKLFLTSFYPKLKLTVHI